MSNDPQAIPLPKSSAHIQFEQLGYCESYDAVVDKLYALLVYKEIKVGTGKWIIRIKSSVTSGTAIDPEHTSFVNALRKASAHGEGFLVWGFNLQPREGDPRFLENRIIIDEAGKPASLEVHLITRKSDGSAMPEVVTSIAWPS